MTGWNLEQTSSICSVGVDLSHRSAFPSLQCVQPCQHIPRSRLNLAVQCACLSHSLPQICQITPDNSFVLTPPKQPGGPRNHPLPRPPPPCQVMWALLSVPLKDFCHKRGRQVTGTIARSREPSFFFGLLRTQLVGHCQGQGPCQGYLGGGVTPGVDTGRKTLNGKYCCGTKFWDEILRRIFPALLRIGSRFSWVKKNAIPQVEP